MPEADELLGHLNGDIEEEVHFTVLVGTCKLFCLNAGERFQRLSFNNKKMVICLLTIIRYGQLPVALLKSEDPRGDKVQTQVLTWLIGLRICG